jgi:hypothetical protein
MFVYTCTCVPMCRHIYIYIYIYACTYTYTCMRVWMKRDLSALSTRTKETKVSHVTKPQYCWHEKCNHVTASWAWNWDIATWRRSNVNVCAFSHTHERWAPQHRVLWQKNSPRNIHIPTDTHMNQHIDTWVIMHTHDQHTDWLMHTHDQHTDWLMHTHDQHTDW